MEKENEIGKESIGKLLIKYSVPAIMSMMITSLYNIADRAFIGAIPNVGPLAIAGLGITMPVFTLIVAFGVFIGMGAATNMSIKLGEGNREEGELFLGNAFTVSIIFSIIIMIFGLIFLDEILYAFGASENTLIYAKEYIGIIFLGTICSVTGFVLNTAIRADGNPKMAAKTMIVGCVLNLILDPIFIFVFDLGIKGAAIATVLCNYIIFSWILYYFFKKKSNLKLRKVNMKLNLKIIKRIFIVGAAPFAVEISAGVVNVLFNNMFKIYGGDLAIGAMTAISTIGLMFMMPVFGITQGVQTIIGYNYGAKKLDRCRKALLLSVFAATVILIIGFLLVELTPRIMISIFNRDESLMNIAVYGIRIYLMTLPILGIVIIGPSYFQAIGKAKHSMVLSLLRQCILLIPLILVLPKAFNLTGVWFVQPIADIISAIIIVVFLAGEFKNFRT